MRTRYGIPYYFYTKPLTYRLEQDLENVDLHVDLSSQNAVRLKSNELDVALLSPIDYARNSSQYRIVPNICVSSKVGNRTVLLHFRKGLRKINTVAADIGLTSELVLAKIILTEKYNTSPQFIPMIPLSPNAAVGSRCSGSRKAGHAEKRHNVVAGWPDVPAMLKKADAALIVGGPFVARSVDSECTIDLVEEWDDLTDLPYVLALWISRMDTLNPTNLYSLKHSLEEGLRHLDEIALSAAEEQPIEAEEYKSHLAPFKFTLDEGAIDSLSEFYRYAFYYGMIGEVPEIRFYPAEEGLDISLN